MTQRLKIPILVTLAALAAASCGAQNAGTGDADGEDISSLSPMHREAEAKERYRTPPQNVAAEDMEALFAGRVFVGWVPSSSGRYSARKTRRLSVVYHGPRGADGTGRYAFCNNTRVGQFFLDLIWWPSIVRKGDREGPVLIWSQSEKSLYPKFIYRGLLVANYDPASGEIVWYRSPGKGPNKGEWFWANYAGHLQERLPAAVYDLCPEFPSPEELGVEVNPAQTADRYDALLAQDPGRRVLRPDLVTQGLRERANGQQ